MVRGTGDEMDKDIETKKIGYANLAPFIVAVPPDMIVSAVFFYFVGTLMWWLICLPYRLLKLVDDFL